jgi:hypothetical protein
VCVFFERTRRICSRLFFRKETEINLYISRYIVDFEVNFKVLLIVFLPYVKVKVKQSRYRPGVTQRVPGS